MKKLISLLTIATFIGLFSGCKKGPDDPFISFRSRDARIMTKWKLTKIEGTQVSPSISGGSMTIAYDGTNYSETPKTGTAKTAVGTYEMTIKGNGVSTYALTYTPGGGASTVESGIGSWYWLNSGKNKTTLYVDGNNYLFPSGIYTVDRLATKELILKYSYSAVQDSIMASYDATYTFTKE